MGGGLSLPFRHFTFVRDLPGRRALQAEAFFCIYEDRVRPSLQTSAADLTAGDVGGWMPAERFRVVREGLRNPGQQVMELVMLTPDALSPADAQTRFAEMLPSLVQTSR